MIRAVSAAIALASCAGAWPSSSPSSSGQPTVNVKNGTLQGTHSAAYNQDFFLGVPFAQPPVGNLRFHVPEPLNSTWTGVKQASSYAKACVGYGSDQWPYEVSEDCLYLNVVRPSNAGSDLPVALWIHGGGYFEGSGVDQRYNLSAFVENSVQIGKPVIGVQIAYRLSAWGFLMSSEVMGYGQTNLGLRDQRLALQWVNENIEAFGGSPKKVTIWGESAGASSVGFHITAYGGRDDKLFRGAIMESGGPIELGPLNGTDYYEPLYQNLVSSVNCNGTLDTLQCLRTIPYETLNAAINSTANNFGSGWWPALDGDFITGYTSLQLASGRFVHVPIIIGTNTDEGTAFSPSNISTEANFTGYLSGQGVPQSLIQQLLAAYPNDPNIGIPSTLPTNTTPPQGAQFRRSAAYAGDYTFIAPRRLVCQTWAKSNVNAFCYRFNVLPAGLPNFIGVTHFQEVAFVFNNTNGLGYYAASPPLTGLQPAAYVVEKLMSSSWASFVSELDPNSYLKTQSLVTPQWPVYSTSNPQNIVWNLTMATEADTYRAEGMALINANLAGVYKR